MIFAAPGAVPLFSKPGLASLAFGVICFAVMWYFVVIRNTKK
jgi:hypothetical protein